MLLADPLNVSIVRLLARRPLLTSELTDRLGPVSRTTRFSRLRDLEELGMIVREKRGGLPPVTHCRLSPTGRRLLAVVRLFDRWLEQRPDGPARCDTVPGAGAIKALALAWNTTALRWLAARPCTLTELDAQSPAEVSYHELRKARAALSETGLIVPVPSDDRGQRYMPTEWTRRAGHCLAAAIRWERRFLAKGSPALASIEAETLLLLLVPLAGPLPQSLTGTCVLQFDDLTSVTVNVGNGQAVYRGLSPAGLADSRISGSQEAWLEALLDGRSHGLRMQGGIRFTTLLTAALVSVRSLDA